MADSTYEIRPIRLDERAEWESLWLNYQAFYKVVIPDQTTAVTWARLHDPAEAMGVFGAYMNGRLCGIVHYLFHRSCWTVGDYCYLQESPPSLTYVFRGLSALHQRFRCRSFTFI